MNQTVVVTELSVHGLLPILVVDDIGHLSEIGESLVHGGLPVAEVTLRTPVAVRAISALAERGDVLVGAGTVLTRDDVDRAVDAGAGFIVSPGINTDVVERALERNTAILPGIATATELQMAVRMGLNAVKVFPAKLLGGVQFIDALTAPFPGVRFMPSGGVGPADIVDYLARPAVFAIGGSWVMDRRHLPEGEGLRAGVERAVDLVRAARGART